MNQPKRWSFYYISSKQEKVRKVRIPAAVLVVSILVFFASLAGSVRSIYFITTYCYARIGIHNEKKENAELIKKLDFLDKLSDKYGVHIRELITFEDKARYKYGINAISEDIRRAGVGGRPSIEQIINASLEDPVIRKAGALEDKLAGQIRQAALQDTTFSRMANHVRIQHDRWAQRPSIWPARGRITSSYGYRPHSFMGIQVFHEGIDIANEVWTPVFATADGVVSFSGTKIHYGVTVVIDHLGSGYTTVYAHLEKAGVKEGQVVKRGELIGYIGNSGRSTGPHLHYEVRHFNKYKNPMHYILPLDVIVD